MKFSPDQVENELPCKVKVFILVIFCSQIYYQNTSNELIQEKFQNHFALIFQEKGVNKLLAKEIFSLRKESKYSTEISLHENLKVFLEKK